NMLKVERNFSDNTLKSYHDDLVQFNHFFDQELINLRTFEYKYSRNYLSYLYSQNLKLTTVSRKISNLRTFYEFCMTQYET
ncbi:site-specific integrase, partial [Staphylococcus haemolyticus]|uniref:site-specific integrase n=1 Tax=Staphylococcus haemolyticus TaxID=1283 RepID=UPI003B7E591E